MGVGHNTETTIGFIAENPVNTIKVRYESLTDITARDFYGIDRITYRGATLCDTDNDGIPNHLDLNSDGR